MNTGVTADENSLNSLCCYRSSAYYDLLNRQKNYSDEARILQAKLSKHGKSPGGRLLDVACGTGQHVFYLRQNMTCQGMDIDPSFLSIARQRLPDVPFHRSDMTTFKLDDKFDVITCLFSSIGYVKTQEALARSVRNMVDHLAPGGLLVIEPWYTPSTFKNGHSTVVTEETENFKIVRMNLWLQKGQLSQGHSHILVMSDSEIRHMEELHELGLFTNEQYNDAMQAAGLDVEYDDYGLIGRGLFVGHRRN